MASACAEPEAEAWGGYGYNGLAGLGYSRAYSTVLAHPVATYGLSPALTGYGGYSTGLRGLWKREAEADSDLLVLDMVPMVVLTPQLPLLAQLLPQLLFALLLLQEPSPAPLGSAPMVTQLD